ncbi:uncharacterized protein LOC135220008 [Macrobrachium nipponense]|uniref:uncharacterized protein LOC135220008 n=1 Tax=Macrobrachium nipponense TaxID=159736 RepID=UPI0030C8B5B7
MTETDHHLKGIYSSKGWLRRIGITFCRKQRRTYYLNPQNVLLPIPLPGLRKFPGRILSPFVAELPREPPLGGEPSLEAEPHQSLGERNDLSTLQTPVGARLALFSEAWRIRGANSWSLEVIENGYKIPFLSRPALSTEPIDLSPSYQTSKQQILLDLLDQMLEKRAVERVLSLNSPGFYNRLFLVPKQSGGWRPVLDVSRLNLFVKKEKFKMETSQSVLATLRPGDWMVSLDLQDAYFHVPIHPRSMKYLRFVLKGQVFQFRALCFGLSTAPMVFTFLMQNVAKWLHLSKIRVSLYLDDWLIRSSCKTKCLEDLHKTLQLTKALGLLVNFEKSHLIPTQSIVYLGIQMDSVAFQAFPSTERQLKCLEKVLVFLEKEICSAREWMSLLGTISSLEKFVSLGRLHLRPLQFFIADNWKNKKDLNEILRISQSVKDHLKWWFDPVKLLEGLSLKLLSPDLVLFSDASMTGWGATLGEEEVSGLWRGEQRSWHINLKELEAIRLALQLFEERIIERIVQINSDNTTALAYIKKQGGTHSRPLFEIARNILLWAKMRDITLLTRFVSGVQNVRADLLSRQHQLLPTEWTLHSEVCRELWRLWGRPLVDLFATSKTKRLPIYCSPVLDPGAIAIDAMLWNWKGMDVYAFPPFKLLGERLVRRGHVISGRLSKDSTRKNRSTQTAPLREVSQKPLRSESDCIQTIEKLARARGFSRAVARAIANARRTSSQVVYQSKWAVFRRWCKRRDVSSSTTSVSQIADFLLHLRNIDKLSVPTIKGYKSMLSTVFRHRGLDLSNNKDLHDLLRSFETSKIPRPRIPSWNLDFVLKFLMSSPFEPLHAASMKDLTRKAVFLTALATAKRVSEIQAMSKHVGFREYNAVCSLSPSFLAKNENPSNPWPKSFEIKGLSEITGREPERVLCPVRALKFYLAKIKQCRGPSDNLWCSVRRPELPMSKNALAFSLRSTIREAHASCPDSDLSLLKIKAHEIRAIATSVAFQKNMALSDILSATYW